MPNRDSFSKASRGAKLPVPSVKSPLPKPSRKGRINQENIYTKYIKWTPLKVIIFAICIGIPYLVAVIATVLAGMGVVAAILIGLAIFSGLIAVLVRWLEKADF